MYYTIKDVAEITNENEHTIRYYAKLGLFPNIGRDQYNSRVFDDDDLEDVKLVIVLADTGMPLNEIKEFMDLRKQGNSTAPQQAEILRQHTVNARQKMIKLQQQVQVLEWNCYKLENNSSK